jgi:APA family basic amino acid/polyamine antiporter
VSGLAELRRDLSLFDVFCIASGAMISSGLFILPGLAFAHAGPSVILSYFIAGLLSVAGMLSIAEMTTAMPKAGGDCYTVIRSMGPAIGTVAGILSWFSLSMKSAFALVGMSVFTILLIPLDIHIIAVAFCLIFLFINLIGIKEAGKTQVVLVVLLFMLMIIYVVFGLPAVHVTRFAPFAPKGFTSILSTSGFVFVSYAGLLKIASIAEEIKNPKRNIPLGMIVSLVVVSIFYTLMVFVTIGVLEPDALNNTLRPITDGAMSFLHGWGGIALSIAAILAFLSTANAGLMTAARSLVPLSRERLLPDAVGRINKRFHTPHVALLITGLFIILSLFLKLNILVEAASIVLILTNILACLSVIILRESRLFNYQPSFRTPLYPWMQIFGVISLAFLLFEMGSEPLIISCVLIVLGIFTYWFYGRIRASKEYALVHLIERVTAQELTSLNLENELKHIIRERDEIVMDRFDHLVEQCPVLDIEGPAIIEECFRLIAVELSARFDMNEKEITACLFNREKDISTALSPFLAIPHLVIPGKNRFDILIARCKQGVRFSSEAPTVKAIIVLIGTQDERNFHLRSLAAVAQIVQHPDFERRWLAAKNIGQLRDIILLGQRKRFS